MSEASQAVAPRARAETLAVLLQRPEYATRFREVLGERAPQFISSVISVARSLGDVEPRSVIGAAMTAAALDLPVDKNLGFSWIVPYKKGDQKFGQFQMGYKGYIQLALRTGQYERMNGRPVTAGAFQGYDAVGEPIIDWSKIEDGKPITGYVFAFKLVNGFTKIAYWTRERVEQHAKRYSQSFRGGYDSPWKTHFDEMCLKTVLSNELRKWGIMSIQMQRAFAADQTIKVDVDSEPEFIDAPAIEERPVPQVQAPPAGPPIPPPAPKAKGKGAKKAEVVEETPPPAGEAPAEAPAVEAEVVTPAPAEPGDIVKQLQEAAQAAEIAEPQIMAWLRTKRLAREDQKRLHELSTAKLENLATAWEQVAPEIKAVKV